jgi:hypothetical protein
VRVGCVLRAGRVDILLVIQTRATSIVPLRTRRGATPLRGRGITACPVWLGPLLLADPAAHLVAWLLIIVAGNKTFQIVSRGSARQSSWRAVAVRRGTRPWGDRLAFVKQPSWTRIIVPTRLCIRTFDNTASMASSSDLRRWIFLLLEHFFMVRRVFLVVFRARGTAFPARSAKRRGAWGSHACGRKGNEYPVAVAHKPLLHRHTLYARIVQQPRRLTFPC